MRVLVEGEEVLFDHRETETGTGTVRLATGSPSEHNQVRKGRRRGDQDKGADKFPINKLRRVNDSFGCFVLRQRPDLYKPLTIHQAYEQNLEAAR